MNLVLFADQCVPFSIVSALRNAGCTVHNLRDHLPIESVDPVVLAKAQGMGAVLLSLNGDFANIVTYPPSQYLGIICLQLQNHPETIPAVVGRLVKYMTENPSPDHYRGRLLIAEVGRIRVRR